MHKTLLGPRNKQAREHEAAQRSGALQSGKVFKKAVHFDPRVKFLKKCLKNKKFRRMGKGSIS